MLNICFSPYLFLRTPALSYQNYNTPALEKLLKTQFFQVAIFFASESLYTELKRFDFDYQLLDNKVKLSLKKYFNRMCYRPTPFGMFSAFSSLRWDLLNGSSDCILDNDRQIYINPDFQFSVDVAREMEKSGCFTNIKYYSNNSIYTTKREKRYLTNGFNNNPKKTDFLIVSYQADSLLNKLINFCKTGKTKEEIIAWLKGFIDQEDEIEEYTNDLIEAGLLIPELYPNMTGEKFFNRLAKIASETDKKCKLADDIITYNKMVDDIKDANDVNIKGLAENDLYSLLKKEIKSMFYVGYEIKTKSVIEKKYQQQIKDGLICLDKLALDHSPKTLNTFRNKFKSKFEDQEIPVLQALDRETGVGYDGSEASLVTSELLDGIQLNLRSNTLNFNWTPVHEFFLSRLSKNADNDCIIITDKELDKIQTQSELMIPPSFSVIFRVFENKVWIEQAGGCTATSLLGRFTLFNKNIGEEVRHIASDEEKLNEDVIFAEISCFNDEHGANINSNAGIREYEIPIGAHSTLNRDKIIDLSDIMLSVVDDKIILRSKKLNKIIIPRLSSAYNYARSELSIFRFLCDLQYQGLQGNYSFDLKSLLPGLNFYPRVEYKSCIIFPCTWILSSDEIAEITHDGELKNNFDKLSKKIGLKKQFALTEGDNQLMFDQNDADSISTFIKSIKNKRSVVLQEVFFDEESIVKNQAGESFTGQFIASVFSNETTYHQSVFSTLNSKRNKVKRIYLPGDEWVYFKLYCHPSISNSLLTKNISVIINHLKKQNKLKGWYFIRYADTEHHLRIRIQTKHENVTEIVQYFEKKMRGYVEDGSLNNLILDTYKRELERYGFDKIEFAEKIFQASSELVVNYLKNISKDIEVDFSELHLALVSVDALLNIFFRENPGKMYVVKSLHERMKHEFESSKQVKFQLDTKYREYSLFINNLQTNRSAIIDLAGKREFAVFEKELTELKLNFAWHLQNDLLKLLGDLIHMHLNRLFNEKQRKHEFIIYYLLYKYYQSLEARREKESFSTTSASKRFSVNNVKEAVFK
ncbi:lantibiotic dehydratase [Mucilaginibacter sp. X4EP1]|uniref:lantibiotic dehydratase n=1 Tax=Mucilaginibacter sp. X4EP1 TaxID=2723092 RepID=UPI002169DB3B|nr:lantibiotic dehydratase [Mucilaginibacter sp. X4EP1]MCS3813594.1 thiopeptide-type bacteriocin biosynthesis protein [Mucilaginibacter sp. X4EP1]